MKVYDFMENGVKTKLINLDGCQIYLNPEISAIYDEQLKTITEKEISIACSVFCKQKPPVDGKPLLNVFYLNPVVSSKAPSRFIVKKHKSYRDYVDFNVAVEDLTDKFKELNDCKEADMPPAVVVADNMFDNATQTKSFFEFWIANEVTFENVINEIRKNATSVDVQEKRS